MSSSSLAPPSIDDGLVPGEEKAVRTWLKKYGFQEGDLRSVGRSFPSRPPMAYACFKGELHVCKWLFYHGAAADITKVDNYGQTPMFFACQNGHLKVCEWLFEVGAAADVDKVGQWGRSPMFVACRHGHLSVCKWLLRVGPKADIHKANEDGITPMAAACIGGHLSVCKWLFEEGAAADISKPDNDGWSPMYCACRNNHVHVCHWLIFHGALNDTQENEEHVIRGAVIRDTRKHDNDHGDDDQDEFDEIPWFPNVRPVLLAWAQDVIATHHTFLHVVLRASVILPESHHQAPPDERCHLPRLPRVVLERLGDLLGVEMGQRLRHARVYAEALAVVVADDEKEMQRFERQMEKQRRELKRLS